MCGITGMVMRAGRPVDEALLRAMTDRVAHRGPDADGYLVEGNVGLGHRRLSIIDTSSAADQPLANEDGRVQVILNGEIYNFQSLVPELEAKGHRFRTRADTEVLVHGWEEWGSGLVHRLRGMFTIALFDARRQRLFLARDRVGKKPLYWARTPEGLFFGSEIKALLAVPGISRELDLEAAGEYMVYGNVVGERSIYRGIRRLLPGHTMTIDTGTIDTGTIDSGAPEPAFAVERYWRFEPRPEPGLDAEEWLAELDSTLAEAVRLRLISDVPLGAFLSGGIDSSLIVSHMARLAPGKVRTFCIGFREAGWDESAHAQKVADYLGTDHHLETVTPDGLAVLPELADTYDEPFGDPSAIPTYYVSKLTRQHVTVALSGDGGDELFCGYRRYVESERLLAAGMVLSPLGRPLARGAAALLPVGSFIRRALDRMSYRGFDLYHHALGFSPEYLSLLAPEVLEALGPGGEQEAAAEFARGDGLGFLDRCRSTDLACYLPDQILVKMDRASMRHALEVRCPLLDQEVVALAGRMPAARQRKGFRQKLLLRELAYRHVPREILERPKQGFAVPLSRWFRREMAPAFRAALADEASLTWCFYDRAEAARRFECHLAGRVNAETALWRLLFFHQWTQVRPAA